MLDMQTRMCVNEELTVELKDTCPCRDALVIE